MKKMWALVRPKVREIAEYDMRNSKMHGSTSVKRSKQREFCLPIDHENFAITKPYRSLTARTALTAQKI